MEIARNTIQEKCLPRAITNEIIKLTKEATAIVLVTTV